MRNETSYSQDAQLNMQTAFCPCRHLISGRTAIPKMCIYRYECWKCAFDQWLDELDSLKEPVPAAA